MTVHADLARRKIMDGERGFELEAF